MLKNFPAHSQKDSIFRDIANRVKDTLLYSEGSLCGIYTYAEITSEKTVSVYYLLT